MRIHFINGVKEDSEVFPFRQSAWNVLVMPCMRLEDKLNRLKTLRKREAQVSNESIEDTLMDLANYAIMTLVEMAQGTSEENAEPKHGEHAACASVSPECQCLTCARDYNATATENGCCMVHGKPCRINGCPDYVREE